MEFNSHPEWGAMGAVFRVKGVDVNPLKLHSDGTVAVYFQYMMDKPVFGDLGRRQELLGRLNAIPGIRLPEDAVNKRKTIPLATFTAETTAQFLAVMDWVVAQLRAGAADADEPPADSGAMAAAGGPAA